MLAHPIAKRALVDVENVRHLCLGRPEERQLPSKCREFRPIDRRTPRPDGFHNLLRRDPALRLIDKLLDARRDVPSCLQSVPMLSRFEPRAFVPGQQVSVRRAFPCCDLLSKVFVASISKNRHRQNSTYSLDGLTIAQLVDLGPLSATTTTWRLLAFELAPKRLELLSELVPQARLITLKLARRRGRWRGRVTARRR